MRLGFAVGIGLLALASGPAFAEMAQPYAGLEARSIKALSPEQVDNLRSGSGMGYALSAELNGYPGPRHVLDLSEPLRLSAEQKAAVQELFAAMRAEAVPLGERLIQQEAELERQFAERRATAATLASATGAIGATEAALRAAHLKYHLLTDALLSRDQVRIYAELRGYESTQPSGSGRGHGQGHGASHPN